MKKLIALLLALAALLALCACGDTAPSVPAEDVKAPAAAQTEKIPEPTKAPSTPAPKPASTPVPTPKPTAEPAPEPEEKPAGVRPEIKDALDSYEKFMDEYVDFMNSYMQNPTDLGLLTKYLDFLAKYEDMTEKIDAMEQTDMNDAELAYYIDVTARVSKKLLTVIS